MSEARELARKLFTSGGEGGKVATHLRLMDGEKHLSGWSEIGIRPTLEAALAAERDEGRREERERIEGLLHTMWANGDLPLIFPRLQELIAALAPTQGEGS